MKEYFKKIIWQLIGKTKLSQYIYYHRNKWRLMQWSRLDHMFIHIPKNAGTSICKALNTVDPGHYTYKQLKDIHLLQNKKHIYCIIRDPISRIISTYNYIKLTQKEHGYNPFSWIIQYTSLDDFILRGLNERIISSNYFLCAQTSYLPTTIDSRIILLNFNDISQEIKKVEIALNRRIELPVARKGKILDSNISKTAEKKIKQLYADDYKLIQNNFN